MHLNDKSRVYPLTAVKTFTAMESTKLHEEQSRIIVWNSTSCCTGFSSMAWVKATLVSLLVTLSSISMLVASAGTETSG